MNTNDYEIGDRVIAKHDTTVVPQQLLPGTIVDKKLISGTPTCLVQHDYRKGKWWYPIGRLNRASTHNTSCPVTINDFKATFQCGDKVKLRAKDGGTIYNEYIGTVKNTTGRNITVQ